MMLYHSPIDDILDLGVPAAVVRLQVEIVEDVEHRVGILEAAELVELSVSHTEHKVARAPGVDHSVDCIIEGVVELQDVPVEEKVLSIGIAAMWQG